MNAMMMLLPTKHDSLAVLQKRRADLLRDASCEGFSFVRGSQDLAMLIGALNKAISQRQDEPRYNGRPVKRYSEDGKTANDRAKENYRTPEDRRKAKSDESRKLRNEMRGGCGGGKKKG